MYSFDTISLIIAAIPPMLRGAVKFMAYIEAAVQPLVATITGMPAYASMMARQARWNGQRSIMEQAINEVFPAGGGLIVVETSTITLDRTVIFNIAELQQPLYVHDDSESEPPIYIYDMAELQAQVDFQVKVPTGAPVDFDAVARFVSRLKIAGKRFEIINY